MQGLSVTAVALRFLGIGDGESRSNPLDTNRANATNRTGERI